jgi:hypothetical protein
MDHLQTRLEALEQQMHTLTQHTRTTQRRLHWWRGLACGAVVLAVLTWALPAGTGQKEPPEGGEKGLAQRVAALEQLLKHFSREGNEVFLTGANLHIVNSLGQTGCGSEEEPIPDCPNGLGNLIVGYNEPRDPVDSEDQNVRTGSHNVVVGEQHKFSRFGGLVVGFSNTISGDFAVVSGGRFNGASGDFASVSGGQENTASGFAAAVSGGAQNTASGFAAAVSGGLANTASGESAAVSGGQENTASGFAAAVSGGAQNTASDSSAAVSGGESNTASGDSAAVSGGNSNTASGRVSSISGGSFITEAGDFSWAAGSEGEEVFLGNFRAPGPVVLSK